MWFIVSITCFLIYKEGRLQGQKVVNHCFRSPISVLNRKSIQNWESIFNPILTPRINLNQIVRFQKIPTPSKHVIGEQMPLQECKSWTLQDSVPPGLSLPIPTLHAHDVTERGKSLRLHPLSGKRLGGRVSIWLKKKKLVGMGLYGSHYLWYSRLSLSLWLHTLLQEFKRGFTLAACLFRQCTESCSTKGTI